VLLICLLTAAGVLLVWGGAYAAAGPGVPRDTTVMGVSIGGLDRDEARARLESELADEAKAPLPVRVGDDTFQISPADAGLSLDAAATLEQADGRTWNPTGLWRSLTGGGEIAPVAAVDDAKLDAAVASLAKEADTTPRDAGVVFKDGEASVAEPRTGREIVRDAAKQAIVDGYLDARTASDGAGIEVEAKTTQPAISAEEAQRAFEEFAEPALSSPVAVKVADATVNVDADTLSTVLSMKPEGAKLVPALDGRALRKAIDDELEDVEQKPRDATLEIADGRPRVVPAKNGRTLKPADLGRAVLEVLPRSFNRVARVELATTPPKVTTEQVRKLGVKEVVGEFTTNYPYAAYRVTNIGRAAEKIDETLLLPGDVFSLNGIVGERTAENGFAAGTIIKNGRFATELGGGVSQVATTVFNAMFFAGLKDVEHKPHSFYISRYPEGREATVAWPVLDLKFENDSPYGVLVDTIHNEGSSLTVRLWSTKVYEIDSITSGRSNLRYGTTRYDPSPGCVAQSGVPGFDVTVTRVFSKGGEEVKRERFFTRYNPADTVHCRAEPRAASEDSDGSDRSNGEPSQESDETPRRDGEGAEDSPTRPRAARS
jgi:vancomycin resistance protein YoaR